MHLTSQSSLEQVAVVTRFDIPLSKIIAIVHDNGINIVAAANNWHGRSSVCCAAHTLKPVINAALKCPRLEKATGAARCLVEHFLKSELASTKL